MFSTPASSTMRVIMRVAVAASRRPSHRRRMMWRSVKCITPSTDGNHSRG